MNRRLAVGRVTPRPPLVRLRRLQIACADVEGPTPLPADAAMRFEALLPGMLVIAQVTGMLSDGIRMVFCGYFEGTVKDDHLGTSSSE